MIVLASEQIDGTRAERIKQTLVAFLTPLIIHHPLFFSFFLVHGLLKAGHMTCTIFKGHFGGHIVDPNFQLLPFFSAV